MATASLLDTQALARLAFVFRKLLLARDHTATARRIAMDKLASAEAELSYAQSSVEIARDALDRANDDEDSDSWDLECVREHLHDCLLAEEAARYVAERSRDVAADISAACNRFEDWLEVIEARAIPGLQRLIDGANDYIVITHIDAVAAPPGQSSLTMVGVPETARGAALGSLAAKLLGVEHQGNHAAIRDRPNGAPLAELVIATNASGTTARAKVDRNRVSARSLATLASAARLLSCDTISTWVTGDASVWRDNGYRMADGVAGGGEMRLELGPSFPARQQAIRAMVESMRDANRFRRSGERTFIEVDSFDILAPEQMDSLEFWSQHGEGVQRYLDLVADCRRAMDAIASGSDMASLQSSDPAAANAYTVFHGSEPVRVIRCGDSYELDGGRHRVAAAQIAALLSGERVTIPVQLVGEYQVAP